MTLEVTGDNEEACSPSRAHPRGQKKEMEAWSPPMLDMMDSNGDFPSHAHNITKWFVYVLIYMSFESLL